jgi:Predicted integral membrane protein
MNKELFYKISRNSTIIYLFGLLFLTYVILASKAGFGSDVWYWNYWTKYIFENGLKNAYKSGTDYLPLYQYILFLFGKFQGSIENIERNIYCVKIITLAFDFLSGFYLAKLLYVKYDKYQGLFYSLFFFFNIAYFYNTLIWNQVDGIMTCFIFLAIYFAIKEKIFFSLLFTLLSINFKLQAIIFIPVVGLLLLPSMVTQFSYKRLSIWLLTLMLLQILIVLPFLLNGDISRMWKVITDSFGKYPVVSMNAFNFWYLILKGNLREVSDSIKFMGISYKNWGLFMFFVTSFIALFPMLGKVFYRFFFNKNKKLSIEQVLIIASIIPMLFFFFNTEMHERYLHPTVLFVAGYALLSKKYFPYALVSIAYFLNLEAVQRFLQLKSYGTLIFHPSFIAFLYLICLIYLFFQLFNTKKEDIVG